MRSGVSDPMDNNGMLQRDHCSKAEVLNDFFCSVFTKEDTSSIPELEIKHGSPKLLNINITEENVIKHLRKLKPDK